MIHVNIARAVQLCGQQDYEVWGKFGWSVPWLLMNYSVSQTPRWRYLPPSGSTLWIQLLILKLLQYSGHAIIYMCFLQEQQKNSKLLETSKSGPVCILLLNSRRYEENWRKISALCQYGMGRRSLVMGQSLQEELEYLKESLQEYLQESSQKVKVTGTTNGSEIRGHCQRHSLLYKKMLNSWDLQSDNIVSLTVKQDWLMGAGLSAILALTMWLQPANRFYWQIHWQIHKQEHTELKNTLTKTLTNTLTNTRTNTLTKTLTIALKNILKNTLKNTLINSCTIKANRKTLKCSESHFEFQYKFLFCTSFNQNH